MEKKTIIKITVWIIAIVVFLCWFIVTGGELYEPGIYIKNYDKDLEGLILEYLSGFEPTNDVIE